MKPQRSGRCVAPRERTIGEHTDPKITARVFEERVDVQKLAVDLVGLALAELGELDRALVASEPAFGREPPVAASIDRDVI
jgi:hypothetical protein